MKNAKTTLFLFLLSSFVLLSQSFSHFSISVSNSMQIDYFLKVYGKDAEKIYLKSDLDIAPKWLGELGELILITDSTKVEKCKKCIYLRVREISKDKDKMEVSYTIYRAKDWQVIRYSRYEFSLDENNTVPSLKELERR